ncbi:MAG: tripartite tricarboxylate transporter TctB family protein [Clostridia bacterium]|nr:tripartite tricarboxylate transporter TctB family protein [Clostridia bacterium]
MDREDKLLAKCLIFAGSFLFTILSFVTLVQTALDFSNAKVAEPTLLKGANLTPLLVVFFLVTIIAIAIVVASFIFTFIKNDKSKTWQNRLLICTIIMLVLTVALYAIMQFSSYISYGAIANAIHNNTTEDIVRKFYTSQFTSAMMLTSISLVINLVLMNTHNKLDAQIVESEPVAEEEIVEEQTTNSEQDELERQIAMLKEQIHIKSLKDQIAQLHNQLGDQPAPAKVEPAQEPTAPVESEEIKVEDNQINIEQALANEPTIDQVLHTTHEDVVQEDAEIKEVEEILGLDDNNN